MEHVSARQERRYLVVSGLSSVISFVLYFSRTVLHTSSSQSVTPARCNVQEHAKPYAALTRSSAPQVMKQARLLFCFFSFYCLFTSE